LAGLIPSARFSAFAGESHPPGRGDSEAILGAIAAFLGDPSEQPGSPPPSAPPAHAPHAVFISYAAEDHAAAATILAALEAANVPCWMAPRDIQPGADYAEAIVEAIEASRAMVVVFSSHSN